MQNKNNTLLTAFLNALFARKRLFLFDGQKTNQLNKKVDPCGATPVSAYQIFIVTVFFMFTHIFWIQS